MTRKIFAFVLLVGMLAGVFSGCAPAAQPTQQPAAEQPAAEQPAAEQPAAPGKVVTLDYYIVGAGDTDQRSLVEAEINKYIEPLIGANVSFHIIGWGDWATKAINGIQAGEKMDVIFVADWYYYMQLATDGLLRPLNDDTNEEYGNLLKQYGKDILDSLNPAFITGTQIDGVNYAVPTNKELTVPNGYLYNITLGESLGLTPAEAAKIKSLKDMEPWLAKAKEADPSSYPYITDGGVGFNPWVPGFVNGVNEYLVNMAFAPNAAGVWDETIVNPLETEWAKDYLGTMHDFYVKGYVHPDAGLTTFDPMQPFNAGKFLFIPMPLKGDNIKAQEMINASGNPDLKVGEIYGQPKINITTHAGGSMLAIPMLSEYPVQAMKLINLMHSDSKLVNMMLFGVEGTHWEYETDGRVNLLNSAWYGAHAGAWTMGDIRLQAVTNVEDPLKNNLLVSYSNDSLNHPSLGFRFRTEPVAAELTAINAVADNYSRALLTGYIDPATELPKYLTEVKAAGLEKVRAEVEKQYNEWKSKK